MVYRELGNWVSVSMHLAAYGDLTSRHTRVRTHLLAAHLELARHLWPRRVPVYRRRRTVIVSRPDSEPQPAEGTDRQSSDR